MIHTSSPSPELAAALTKIEALSAEGERVLAEYLDTVAKMYTSVRHADDQLAAAIHEVATNLDQEWLAVFWEAVNKLPGWAEPGDPASCPF